MKNKFKRLRIYSLLRLIYILYTECIKRNRIIKLRLKWRDLNKHNYTAIVNGVHDLPFPIEKVIVGNHTYGDLFVVSYENQNEFLKIGNFCSIASGVKFLLGGEHNYNYFSTFPFKRILIDRDFIESSSKGSIIIEDHVWIGIDAIILSGVEIATGTIIAAGSVVTKSTEPYSIIAGNPARLIKKRFEDDIINKLKLIDNKMLTDEFIRLNIDFLYSKINNLWFEKLLLIK